MRYEMFVDAVSEVLWSLISEAVLIVLTSFVDSGYWAMGVTGVNANLGWNSAQALNARDVGAKTRSTSHGLCFIRESFSVRFLFPSFPACLNPPRGHIWVPLRSGSASRQLPGRPPSPSAVEPPGWL